MNSTEKLTIKIDSKPSNAAQGGKSRKNKSRKIKRYK